MPEEFVVVARFRINEQHVPDYVLGDEQFFRIERTYTELPEEAHPPYVAIASDGESFFNVL